MLYTEIIVLSGSMYACECPTRKKEKKQGGDPGFTEYLPNVLFTIQLLEALTLIRPTTLKITFTQIRSNEPTPLPGLVSNNLGITSNDIPARLSSSSVTRLAWSLRFSRFWRNVLEGTGNGDPANPPAEVKVIIIEDSDGAKAVIGFR